MQWIFSLILIAFFQAAPVFADESQGVAIKLSSGQQKTVSPKTFFTSVFTITNTGNKQDAYILEVNAPSGWQVISSLSEVSLSPKEEKTTPITIFVPLTALAAIPYEIKFSAIAASDPSIKSEAAVVVHVLPHARLKLTGPQGPEARLGPGQAMNYNFTIVNLGNGKDSFQITAVSAHGEKVDLSNDIVELEVGEQRDVQATIHIPLEVSPGTKHCLTLRASSISLERGVYGEVVVYTQITEKRPRPEGAYKTLSSQITTHLSGIGSGDKSLGPQIEFNTNGYVTDNYRMNFDYQGPYYKNRENYRSISQERTTFDFGNKMWDVGLGDIAVNLSELTVSSLYERGQRFHAQKNWLDAMGFSLEKRQTGFTEDIKGGRAAAKIGPYNEIAVNLYQSDETKTDSSYSRSPEKKQIASFSGVSRISDLLIEGEYGKSKFDNDESGYKNDSAWWIESRMRKDRFYIDGEYLNAGENYPGRRTDTKSHRAYISYRVFKPQWIWVYNHKIIDNPKKDVSRNWNDNERNEVGTSFNIKTLPFFSFSYQVSNTKSEKVTPISDTEEKAFIFRSNKTISHVTASIDAKWSRQTDDVTAADSKGAEYTARLNGRWQKFTPWIGYAYNTEKDIAQGSNTNTTRKEVGLYYKPDARFNSSFSFSQEGTGSEKPRDALSFDMTYIPVEDTSFTIEGEMRDNHDELNREWQVWLTLKRSFDMPVPIKLNGTIAGVVFIDQNNNGKFDSGEIAMPKITMLIADDRRDTGKDGRYKFPAVNPGEVFLDIDAASLPVGLAPSITLPYKIDIGIGKTKAINIPLLKTAKVRGVVFEDANRNGKRDADEKGLSLVRIIIAGASSKQRDTFSNNNGYYSFTGVIPGKYEVKIETKWLPNRYGLTTAESYSVDLGQADEKLDLDFGAVEKERPILKTYTTQSSEPPNQ